MPFSVGIIGYGSLGLNLAKRIISDPDMTLSFVHDVDSSKINDLPERLKLHFLSQLSDKKADLVVELSSAAAVAEVAPVVLQCTDLMIVSVSAFAAEGLKEKLDSVARQHHTRYYISHGAIVGLDGIRDGREIIEDIHITTVRPQEGYGLKKKLFSRTVLYDGSTRGACVKFPHNVNIHASLALHGLGFDRTQSTVIADPTAKTMNHVIEVKGKGLKWKIAVTGKPLGARNAAYVPESVYQTVRRIGLGGHGMNLV